MNGSGAIEAPACRQCALWSNNGKSLWGYCLHWERETKASQICGAFHPDAWRAALRSGRKERAMIRSDRIIWLHPARGGRTGDRAEIALNARGLLVTGPAADLVGMREWRRVGVGFDPVRGCLVLARLEAGGWAVVRHEKTRSLTIASRRLVEELRRMGIQGRRFVARADGPQLIAFVAVKGGTADGRGDEPSLATRGAV